MSLLKKFRALEATDKAGVGLTLGLLGLVTFNDLCTLYVYSSDENSHKELNFALLLLGLYILFNVFGNMYRAFITDTTVDSIELQVKQLPDWNYCSYCEIYAPPRAYHCYTCRKCILKRHNHCNFLGKCVGYKNHRFYILFIFYVWLGALFSTYLNWAHFTDAFNTWGFKSFMTTIMPMFALFFGLLNMSEFFFTFVNSICFILTLLMFFYLLINLKLTLSGQTWHENAKNINIYNVNREYNLKQVFGRSWLLSVFNPFTSLDLTGNGTSFRSQKLPTTSQDSSELNSNNFYGYNNQNTLNDISKRRII
jgi:palmitoyltransferase